MINFTINRDLMSRVGAPDNETFREWHEIQRRDKTPVKNNGNITSTSWIKYNCSIQKCPYIVLKLTL